MSSVEVPKFLAVLDVKKKILNAGTGEFSVYPEGSKAC